jgi:hypothetical protein
MVARSFPFAAAALAAASLAACAAAAPEPPWQDRLAATGWTVGEEVETVPAFSFDGFDALDDAHLVIHVGTARRVLVTTGPGCVALDDAHRVAWRGSGHTLSRLDPLRIAPAGVLPSRCLVDSIRLLVPPPR